MDKAEINRIIDDNINKFDSRKKWKSIDNNIQIIYDKLKKYYSIGNILDDKYCIKFFTWINSMLCDNNIKCYNHTILYNCLILVIDEIKNKEILKTLRLDTILKILMKNKIYNKYLNKICLDKYKDKNNYNIYLLITKLKEYCYNDEVFINMIYYKNSNYSLVIDKYYENNGDKSIINIIKFLTNKPDRKFLFDTYQIYLILRYMISRKCLVVKKIVEIGLNFNFIHANSFRMLYDMIDNIDNLRDQILKIPDINDFTPLKI